MFINKKTTLFKKEKFYLTDINGRKIVDLGFDKIQFLNNGKLMQYWLGGKTNIVSTEFVKENKTQEAYTYGCVWDDVNVYDGFYLLSTKNKAGLKLINESNKLIIKSGSILTLGDRYIVVNNKNGNNLELVYLDNDQFKRNEVQKIKTTGAVSPSLFDLKGNFEDSSLLVDEDDLKSLVNLFKIILVEDLKNYNQPTKKYILANSEALTFEQTLSDELDKYIVRYDERQFETIEEAAKNAKNILKLLREKVTKRFESEKQPVQEEKFQPNLNIPEDAEISSACDDLINF